LGKMKNKVTIPGEGTAHGDGKRRVFGKETPQGKNLSNAMEQVLNREKVGGGKLDWRDESRTEGKHHLKSEKTRAACQGRIRLGKSNDQKWSGIRLSGGGSVLGGWAENRLRSKKKNRAIRRPIKYPELLTSRVLRGRRDRPSSGGKRYFRSGKAATGARQGG